MNECYGCMNADFSERSKVKRVGLNDLCESCEDSSNRFPIHEKLELEVRTLFDINETQTISKIQRELQVGYKTASWLFDNCL